MTDTPSQSRKPKNPERFIGDHQLDPSTLMMGHGFDPSLSEGSLKPPIFLTSTFVFENAEEGKRFFEGITKREFLDRAARYAVGGLTATAILGMMSPNYALAENPLTGKVAASGPVVPVSMNFHE